MQLLVDFLPIVVFFVVYVMTTDLFLAMGVLMVLAPLVFVLQYLLTRKVNKLSAVSTALLIVLGGGALLLNNKMIFLWKPTVFYWLAAIAFLASRYIGQKTIIQRIMDTAGKDSVAPFQLTQAKWSGLNLAWVAFFVIAGALNIYVAYHFPEATWVKFKLFGLLGLTFSFVIAQSVWLAKQIDSNSSE